MAFLWILHICIFCTLFCDAAGRCLYPKGWSADEACEKDDVISMLVIPPEMDSPKVVIPEQNFRHSNECGDICNHLKNCGFIKI